jgi:hypothetical protein
MKIQCLGFCTVLALVGSLTLTAFGDNYSPVQSAYRPRGWQIYDRVQTANCDTLAQAFEADRATILQCVTSSLTEGMRYVAASQHKLDPQRLYFFSDYAPRVYFFMNGGWYTDALGVTICPAAPSTGSAPVGTNYLVFPNGNSCYSNSAPNKQTNGQRTQAVPLLSGDFVQLPTVKAGQQLALVFFTNLDSNGNPTYTFYNEPKANPDGLQHCVAFFPGDSQYIVVSFEDQTNSGDGDCNDEIVVIDVGPDNARILKQATNGTLPK